MKLRKCIFHYKNMAVLMALLLAGDASLVAQRPVSEAVDAGVEYSCVSVPDRLEFCGETIDLTRFDRHERMDRELLAFCYMHSTSLQIIKRANRYFPVVEPILADNGVPDDFKYLMAIESNVDPLARSGVGAAGLWQFMPETGREFGLTVNNHVDERYHVEKATRAACKYLKQAYANYKSWISVAAAYNAGQARIARELQRQYADEALDLHLVTETARYVYRILAVKQLLADPRSFGFRLRASDLYPPVPYREIKVTRTIEDLPRFAKQQGINYALLRHLNPWIRSQTLPVHGGQQYALRIPDAEGMYYSPRVTLPHNPAWVVE